MPILTKQNCKQSTVQSNCLIYILDQWMKERLNQQEIAEEKANVKAEKKGQDRRCKKGHFRGY